MKLKAMIVIMLCVTTISYLPQVGYLTKELNSNDEINYSIDNITQNLEENKIYASEAAAISNPSDINSLDLTSPSYTFLSSDKSTPQTEGEEIILTSQTNSTGYGVSSGTVDFIDMQIQKIDDDPTSDVIYSNKFAIKISLSVETPIVGFSVDLSPTIREDINFYIRESLTGTNLREGQISGYIANSIHITDQMLYVPFSYCGGASSLTLEATTDYYFILEPTVSTSDTFFELRQSDDNPDNVTVYEWWNNDFEIKFTDVNFNIIIAETIIDSDITVSSGGSASTNWVTVIPGDHAIVAWYKGSAFYAESMSSLDFEVIESTELFTVNLNPCTSDYLDYATIDVEVLDASKMSVENIYVTLSISEDNGQSWLLIDSELTNSSGIASIYYQFTQLPGNYSLKAYVNAISINVSYILIEKEQLIWYNIDFTGQYRNNPGTATDTKIEANIFVQDNDGTPVANMDFELWYKIDGSFEWIPHYYTTNASGYATVTTAFEDMLPGEYLDSHYFAPASYLEEYTGISTVGSTTVEKGMLNLTLNDYYVDWNSNARIEVKVESLADPWSGIVVQFYYFENNGWHFIDTGISNSSGYASIIWEDISLSTGSYQLRATSLESTLFESQETFATMHVNQTALNLYLVKDSLLFGNGEEVDVEYMSSLRIQFYAEFQDGTPAANMVIQINSRLLFDVFYETIGYVTTNGSGYAIFNDYETFILVGNQYLCTAVISGTSEYEEAALYFKINLIKTTPIINFGDHLMQKGTATELIAETMNSDGRALRDVHIRFSIAALTFEGTTDFYGIIRIQIAPELLVGQHQLICEVISDDFYNPINKTAKLVVTKGTPNIILADAAAIVDGYLILQAKALDSLGRPLANLDVRITFQGLTIVLTTDSNGEINHPTQITGISSGYYLSVLTFEGDSEWFDITTTATILIYENESEIEIITPSLTAIFGEDIYVEAQLTTETGQPLENRQVQFYILFENGTIYTIGYNTTNSFGYVSYYSSLHLKPNSYNLYVKYLGAVDYGPAKDSISLLIEKADCMLIGTDIEVVINSTAKCAVTLVDYFGAPINQELIHVYVWYNNEWILLGNYLTDSFGIADISFLVPFAIGDYDLKFLFQGNDYYVTIEIIVEMEVLAAPPKITPSLVVENTDLTIADHEELIFELTVSNYLDGTSILIHVLVDGIYNGSCYIIDGVGYFSWKTSTIGTFNLTFLSVEDSVYFTTSKMVTIEVIENIAPELLGYYYKDIICQGEELTVEATFFDDSGIAAVWFTANGTRYDMTFNGASYSGTAFHLSKGNYNITICAEDKQQYFTQQLTKSVIVIDRKTQLVKYTINGDIIDFEDLFTIDVFIYTEHTVEEVNLYLNSTAYSMSKSFQLDAHQSGWRLELSTLGLGLYYLELEIIENTDGKYSTSLNQQILIIPNKPELKDYNWNISTSQGTDYISGTIIVNSYFQIQLLELWLDNQRITITKIDDVTYSFEGYFTQSKTHVLKIKITDIKGRVFQDEIVLDTEGKNPGIVALIIVSIIVSISLLGGGLFVTLKKKRTSSSLPRNSSLELPELDEQLTTEAQDDDLDSNLSALTPDSNESSGFDLYDGLLPGSSASAACSEECFDEEMIQADIDEVEITPEPAFDEVKDYIAKVKQDGLIPGADTDGNGKESITDLSTLAIEIDHRLLPEEERKKKEEELKKLEKSTVMNLKDIAEEIEQTLVK